MTPVEIETEWNLEYESVDVNVVKHSVEIETEWNLEFCGQPHYIYCMPVEIETEWNLEVNVVYIEI